MNPLSNIHINLVDSFGISALGFSIVFFVLIALMVMIRIMRTVMEGLAVSKASKAAAAPAAAAAPSAPAAANPNMIPAKGSLGEVMLHGVDDQTAAMIMAIVADTMGAPLNELRFHSIREKN